MTTRVRRFVRRVADAPFDMLLGFVFLLSSLSYLLGAPQPHSIQSLLPHWLVLSWSMEALAGSVLVIIGLATDLRRPFASGMALLAGASFIYGVAIVFQSYVIGGIASTFLAAAIEWAVAGACLLRAIRRWL